MVFAAFVNFLIWHSILLSALHFAAALGSVECVKVLVEAGADVNLQDKEGMLRLPQAI